MNRALCDVELSGKVLDIGGRKSSNYHQLIQGNPKWTVANLDTDSECDITMDAEKHFPFDDESFDHILCLNLLEHVYDVRNVLSDSYRCIHAGVKMIIVTPFLIPVHGCPHDFRRFTMDALRKMLKETGFEITHTKTLGCGALVAGYQMTSWLIPISLLRTAFRLTCTTAEWCAKRLSKRYKCLSKNYALGFMLHVQKPTK